MPRDRGSANRDRSGASGYGDYQSDSTQVDVGSQAATIGSQPYSRDSSTRSRPITRQLARRVQIHQQKHEQPVTSTKDIMAWDDNRFHDLRLTPPPLPSTMRPIGKRKLEEWTREELEKDNSPPHEKDKLTQELEEMERHLKYGEEAGSNAASGYGNRPSGSQRKKTKVVIHQRKKPSPAHAAQSSLVRAERDKTHQNEANVGSKPND